MKASFKGSIRAPLRDLQGFFSGFFNVSCQGSSGFDRSFIRVQDAESSGLVIRGLLRFRVKGCPSRFVAVLKF